MRHIPKTVPHGYVASLATLFGDSGDRMRHFTALSHDEQAAAIRRMAADGYTEYGIASATKLAVEYVRMVLAERAA